MGFFKARAKNDEPFTHRKLATLYLIKHRDKQPKRDTYEENIEKAPDNIQNNEQKQEIGRIQ